MKVLLNKLFFRKKELNKIWYRPYLKCYSIGCINFYLVDVVYVYTLKSIISIKNPLHKKSKSKFIKWLDKWKSVKVDEY